MSKDNFDFDNCPLQLWLNKYNSSLERYNKHKFKCIKACNDLQGLTGWNIREMEQNQEWSRDYV